MADRNLSDLHDDLKQLCNDFLDKCAAAGLHVFIVTTWRSPADQDALYAQGRTTPGHIVTNARAGQSAHNFTLPDGTPASKAFDIGVMLNGKYDAAGLSPDWHTAGQIGTAIGLDWYGAPDAKFHEMPHFQLAE